MFPIDENILLIAFIAFAIFVVLGAFILRRMTVDDIFSDDKVSSIADTAFDDRPIKQLSSGHVTIGSDVDRSGSPLTRENINKLAKVLTAIGTVMIFAPLPESVDGLGFGLAFIGYLLTRATNQPKEKQNKPSQMSLVTTLRQLASKPEYREAMQILAADMADKKYPTQIEQRRRAIRYLESQGVSSEEANRNIAVLAGYIAQQNQK